MNIHFICRGNALRSVMAETYLNALHITSLTVHSSGTIADQYRPQNEPILQSTTALLQDLGYGTSKPQAEQLTPELIHDGDITICLNRIVFDEANKLVKLPSNTLVWDVEDAGEGHRSLAPSEKHTKYDKQIFAQIKSKVDELVKDLA